MQRLASLLLVPLFLLPLDALGAADPTFPTVTTLAGSGESGFTDGVGVHARFLLPLGMAYDGNGNLFVADAGAQRIRVIDEHGAVTTVAGGGALHADGLWVDPGYVDGDVSIARFNRPSGVAVSRAGVVYVADYGNHCIRKIAGGRVSTYVGSPDRPGGDFGNLSAARLERPVSLAIDGHDNLYVADEKWGVRVIRPSGEVSPVGNLPRSFGVAVFENSKGTTVFVADVDGIEVIAPIASDARHYHATDISTPRAPNDRYSQGQRPIGHPFGIAALDDHTVVYTDLYSNTVRYLSTYLGRLRILAGLPTESATADGATYRDGVGTSSRFFAPTGVAARGNHLAVAEMGNRRIRSLTPFDHRDPILAGESPLPDLGTERRFRIVYAGNSFTYWDASASDSIQSLLEERLRAVRAGEKFGGVAVFPIWVGGSRLDATSEYLKTSADAGLINAVILPINATNVSETYGVPREALVERAGEWQPKLTESLRLLDAALRRSNVSLLVALHPYGPEVSSAERAFATFTYEPQVNPPDSRLGTLMAFATQRAGARVVDLYPAFAEAERSAKTRALFMSNDEHFSVFGRQLVAEKLSDELKKWQPWSR